jgi:RimJ/RimL family protein N-acetyltransferase
MPTEVITLEGRFVRLEPLAESHLPALCEIGLDPELWRITTTLITSPEDLAAYVRSAVEGIAARTMIPFATIDRESGRVVGSTRFAAIDRTNRRAEIGWTWVARPWQRTRINTEAKYLMLRHAFETLGLMRVEFKTDRLNTRSRNALLRIGARQEGIFRKHMVVHDGRMRDSVYFSITDDEWPRVKEHLEAKLAATAPAEGLVEVHSLSDSQIEDLWQLYTKEWWTLQRKIEDVRRMIGETRVLVGFADAKTGRLIAFARAVTDFVYKALILDVIIDESARGTGLGRRLMDAILNHPELRNVKNFELYCRPELVPFYEKWEFAEVPPGLRFMRRNL